MSAPESVTALSFIEKGNLQKTRGNLQAAIASYKQAIAINPNLADAYAYLAEAYTERGEWQDAISNYERAIAIKPDVAVWLAGLGSVLERQGWQELAIPHYCRALDLDPQFFTVESHLNVGNMLRERGRWQEAIARYHAAIQLQPHNPLPYQLLARTMLAAGDLIGATESYRKAASVDLEAISAKEYNDLGIAWMGQGEVEQAIACFQEAISVQPDYADAHCNLGNAFVQIGNVREGLLSFQEALAIDPQFVAAYYNLGTVLAQIDKLDEAVACFEAAVELDSSFAEAYYNSATALVKQNNLSAAIGNYERAIQLQPHNPHFHWNLGFALLLNGELERGFVEYDWRWRAKSNPYALPRSYKQSLWQGEDLSKKTILLYDDQGFGDFLQLIRYTHILTSQCQQIIIETPLPLVRLIQDCFSKNFEEKITVVPQGNNLPNFDFHMPMISLPRLCRTTLETIPRDIPYLDAEGIAQPDAFNLLNFNPQQQKVGLVWASGYKSDDPALVKLYYEKSCPLAQLEPLLDVDFLNWYSLQVGRNADDIHALGWQEKLTDLSPNIQDFGDTAALIAQMDLIISVDTAVAHLAGAMGKPTWLILPFSPDWRWLLERTDSPWYPTMRLFRQPQAGDWASAIAQIKSALEAGEW